MKAPSDLSAAASQQAVQRNVRVFGVDYLHLDLPEGDLYLTEFGQPFMHWLMPDQWNDLAYYQKPDNRENRVRLEGSANPFKIRTKPVDGKAIDIVVKWCRVGSQVQIYQSHRADHLPEADLSSIRWNSPFEEFGLLKELRDSNHYYQPRILTQRPFAIYSPKDTFPLWQLGREHSSWKHHQRKLAQDQYGLCAEEAIEFDIQRVYAVIYGWVKGEDAAKLFPKLELSAEELEEFTEHVYYQLLLQRGYEVADTKPAHFILRQNGKDVLRDEHGRPQFALIDFELLSRTPDYENKFRSAQRHKYFRIQSIKDVKVKSLPPLCEYQNVFGVDYTFTHAANNGRLWIVGSQPDLVDFFEPSRWRSQPRVQLSSICFRTCSQDNVQIIYRISRCGIFPDVNLNRAEGRRIRQFGYNSPFEVVALAEQLRALGIPTIYPRAIYRTSHESLPAEWLLDESRYESHKNLRAPDGEPLLSHVHDYFTLWGHWRGHDPLQGYRHAGHWGLIDLEQAVEKHVISEDEYQRFWQNMRPELKTIIDKGRIRNDRISLHFEDGHLARDKDGRLQVTITVNGTYALLYGLISKKKYNALLRSIHNRLAIHGYEALNLKGDHLIMPTDNRARLRPDPANPDLPHAALCNFSLIRAPWMHYNVAHPRKAGE
ncbi:hypothetical protein JXA32_15065 [Candidatus Sumerlaeota bacterium]|nr:hypothetical protein [Candidatus Sumerlaeota bacterium]